MTISLSWPERAGRALALSATLVFCLSWPAHALPKNACARYQQAIRLAAIADTNAEFYFDLWQGDIASGNSAAAASDLNSWEREEAAADHWNYIADLNPCFY